LFAQVHELNADSIQLAITSWRVIPTINNNHGNMGKIL